jgi:hypothetical protein
MIVTHKPIFFNKKKLKAAAGPLSSGFPQHPTGNCSVSTISFQKTHLFVTYVFILTMVQYTIAQRFPGALLDITTGSDNGNGFMCNPGFKPAPGWDPITGPSFLSFFFKKSILIYLFIYCVRGRPGRAQLPRAEQGFRFAGRRERAARLRQLTNST